MLGDAPLSRILELLDEAVLVLEAGHGIIAWNPVAGRLLGLTHEDVGRSIDEVAGVGAEVALARPSGAGPGAPRMDVDAIWIDAHGVETEVLVRTVAAPLRSGGDGMVVIGTDLSEQRLMQRAMADQHERIQEMQTLAHVGLWVWDRDADNLQWTDELYRMHELDPMAFDGSLDAQLAPIPDTDRDMVRQELMAVVEGRSTEVSLTYPIDTPAGRRWLSARARATVRGGRIVGLVGTCQDVTARQRYAVAIEAANQELERFARAVAHDLKSPLTVMVGMAELIALKLEPEEGSDLQTMLDKIRDSGLYAADMISELMRSARRRARERSFSPVDMGEVVAAVRRGLAIELEAAEAEFKVGPLPVVDGSRALLRQVMRNLVGNAIKYRHPDRRLRIEVTGSRRADGWEVCVADNGRGIPISQRHVVFDAGVRLHADYGVAGDGHGLATVRSIVEQHRGSILVDEGIDGGCAFFIRLPRHEVDDDGHDVGWGASVRLDP